jgi:Undecaprenyl-phosphate glucose phosphotransferase
MVAGLLLLDLAVTGCAWTLAYLVRFESEWIPIHLDFPPLETYLSLLPLLLLVAAAVYRTGRLYLPRRVQGYHREIWALLRANFILFFAVFTFTNIYQPSVYSRAVFVLFSLINFGMLVVSRVTFRMVLRHLRKRGYNRRYALVVGTGPSAQNLVEVLKANAWTAVEPIGFLESKSQGAGSEVCGLPVLGTCDDLGRILGETTVDQIFIALSYQESNSMEVVFGALGDQMIDVKIVPDTLSLATLNTSIGQLDGVPIISLRESPLYGLNLVAKRLSDIFFALVALLVFSLPMMLIAALVRWSSPGPVIYRQRRMGLDGRTFDILKFRTMKMGAEIESGAVWAQEGDPRKTFLGTFLRKTSLDELPQFVNVLRGEMSVVGPRPERPEFIEKFRREIPRYMLRHKMKAGITGWAQVNGWRGNTSIKKRIQFDLYYIENWSLWFDIRIMFLTLFRGFVNENAY